MLARVDVVEQLGDDGIVPGVVFFIFRLVFGELFDPLFEDLHVAEFAEGAEELASGLFHFFPGGIGVEGDEAIGEGAAATDGDAEIVNGIGLEAGGGAVTLDEDTLHPGAEADFGLGVGRPRGRRGRWLGDDG
jgi:hypothetical protein